MLLQLILDTLPRKLMVLTDLEVFEVLLGSSGGRHVGMQYEMKFYLLPQCGGEYLPLG